MCGSYLERLRAFCQQNGLDAECGWYDKAIARLAE
jgi:hypothetical protein